MASPSKGPRFTACRTSATGRICPRPRPSRSSRSCHRGGPRALVFRHEGRKLAGWVEVRGDESQRPRVRLEPWGVATGRLVDPEGKPLADVTLAGPTPTKPRLGGSARSATSPNASGPTPTAGSASRAWRPGVAYHLYVQAPMRHAGREDDRDPAHEGGRGPRPGQRHRRVPEPELMRTRRVGAEPSSMNRQSTSTIEVAWSPYDPKADGAVGPASGRPSPPPRGLRGLVGGATARPEGRPRAERRAAARRQGPRAGRGRARGVRVDRDGARRRRRRLRRPRAAEGLVGLPDALRPRPAGRAADPALARPLRHEQPQGRRPRRDAPAERDAAPRWLGHPFGDLLNAAVRDPALLAWLDASANRKGHPNENLARELMELFTLGVGHFSEPDVKDAARALTGWSGTDGAFHEDAAVHDDGDKSILGRKGRWSGGDLVKILLDQPATAERLAWRLVPALLRRGGDRSRVDLRAGRRAEGQASSTSAGASRRSSARGRSSPSPTCGRRCIDPIGFVLGAGPCSRALGTAAEHAGAGRLVGSPRARPVLSARTSAAGAAGGRGSRPARSSGGRITRRPSSRGRGSAEAGRSMPWAWRPVADGAATAAMRSRSSPSCCLVQSPAPHGARGSRPRQARHQAGDPRRPDGRSRWSSPVPKLSSVESA